MAPTTKMDGPMNPMKMDGPMNPSVDSNIEDLNNVSIMDCDFS